MSCHFSIGNTFSVEVSMENFNFILVLFVYYSLEWSFTLGAFNSFSEPLFEFTPVCLIVT
jgi:hypothetical protein